MLLHPQVHVLQVESHLKTPKRFTALGSSGDLHVEVKGLLPSTGLFFRISPPGYDQPPDSHSRSSPGVNTPPYTPPYTGYT